MGRRCRRRPQGPQHPRPAGHHCFCPTPRDREREGEKERGKDWGLEVWGAFPLPLAQCLCRLPGSRASSSCCAGGLSGTCTTRTRDRTLFLIVPVELSLRRCPAKKAMPRQTWAARSQQTEGEGKERKRRRGLLCLLGPGRKPCFAPSCLDAAQVAWNVVPVSCSLKKVFALRGALHALTASVESRRPCRRRKPLNQSPQPHLTTHLILHRTPIRVPWKSCSQKLTGGCWPYPSLFTKGLAS